jgi:hypothetical protein
MTINPLAHVLGSHPTLGGVAFREYGAKHLKLTDDACYDDLSQGEVRGFGRGIELFLQSDGYTRAQHDHRLRLHLRCRALRHRSRTVAADTSLPWTRLGCIHNVYIPQQREGNMNGRSGTSPFRLLRRTSCEGKVREERKERSLPIVPVRTVPQRGPLFRLIVVASALTVGVLASCTSKKAGPTFDTRPPSTVPSATTSAVVVTTTKVAATSTVPVTTAPPATTTVAVSTTPPPPNATEQAVRAAIDKVQANSNACMTALPKCEVATLAATQGGTSLEQRTKLMTQYNAEGQVSRNRDRNHYKIESVTIQAPDRASAVVCNTDGSERVRPGAGPNGIDIIVDDLFVSRRDTYEMQLDADGVWRLYGGSIIGNPSAVDLCPVA